MNIRDEYCMCPCGNSGHRKPQAEKKRYFCKYCGAELGEGRRPEEECKAKPTEPKCEPNIDEVEEKIKEILSPCTLGNYVWSIRREKLLELVELARKSR